MTMTVRAISADQDLLERVLGRGFAGEVHSVFDAVINVQGTDGGLITLAAAHLGNAPNTILLGAASLSPLRARLGRRVVGESPRLVCPGIFAIDLTEASGWRPELPDLSEQAAGDGLAAMATELGLILADAGRLGGIRPGLRDEGSIAHEVSRTLEAASEGFVEALADGDLTRATGWAQRLIGLGPGLTPSGDDFLTGFAAVCASPGTRVHTLLPWVQDVVRTAADRTNLISWTAMHEAAAGRVRESIVSLLTAVAAGDVAAVQSAARTVISIGSTSGTDIVGGMQAALHLEKEMRGVA